MLAFIFTIDYEIYGNGEGSLRGLVYDPVEALIKVFDDAQARFVAFVEVSELEQIERQGADAAVIDVKRQVADMHARGFEIGLHLHPQWCNARYEEGRWQLDYSEYNLCTLSRKRIEEIVGGGISHLRGMVGDPSFMPRSFRAGNWLFQPTQVVSAVLAQRGLWIDSSVFKGGVQRLHGLDYRPSKRNGYYWQFREDVNVACPDGPLLEIPIHVTPVPFWRMVTAKRVGMQRRNLSAAQPRRLSFRRGLDYLRFWHPMKLDFCRMTLDELKLTVDAAIRLDHEEPSSLKPLVAIGHSKDLVDVDTVASLLHFLKERGVVVTTLDQVYQRCRDSL